MIHNRIHPLRRVTGIFLYGLLCTLAILSFDACRPQLPNGVIGEGKMERILYDYHMAQSIAENTTPDSGNTDTYRYELIQAVFRKHGVSEEQFEESMNFYCSDLQRLHNIYKNLERRYEREANAFGQTTVARDVYANLSAEGDTANVWGGQPIAVIRNNVQENLFVWEQTCDSTCLPGDEFLWRFMPLSFSTRGMRSITADLVVYYSNDSIRAAFHHGTNGSQMEIRVNNPNGWTPSAVAGHIYMAVGYDRQEPVTVAATDLKLIRLHVKRNVEEKQPVDSVIADTLAADSVEEVVPQAPSDDRRLSPDEFRRQQTVDQKIDIVKEKPYVRPRQPQNRRRMQQPHLAPRRNQRRQ